MAEGRTTKWYIYCKDDRVNEDVAEAMRGLQATFGEYECSDGKKRHLYEMPNYQRTREIRTARGKRVQVFRTQGNSLPTPVDPGTLKKKKMSLSDIKEASDALKQKNMG